MNTTHMAIYLAVMMILIICCNMFGSKWFGEIEASFGYIKVCSRCCYGAQIRKLGY